MQQNKLFVGNIAFSITQFALKELFSSYGENEVQLVTDRNTGRPRGFAFITFSAQKDAEAALKMNGKIVGGRNLVVNMAKEKSNKGYHNRRKY